MISNALSFTKLRQEFLDFFKERGHKIVSSSSLLPTDPTVLFTTAGMQQFKPYYLGEKSPYGPNVASCQKCFRTSDIEQVGDESHLTFLEMLGNFSFGGYFKEEAISAAYELLNSKFKIQKPSPAIAGRGGRRERSSLRPSKITITVFEGNKEVPRDNESVKIWSKFGFSEKNGNLRFCGREDNFWGPTGQDGPCGPTTEIYINGVEIWNLVFNEYYQDKNRKLAPLEQRGVDTGMGLERLAMIMQGKHSVFETDLFEPIVKEIEEKSSINYKLRAKSYRIIADHIKSSVFLISEGILPSNVERGYVLRRVLRRAIRYGKLLDLPKNFFVPPTQKVIEIYQDVYPEVKSKEADILTVIQQEEEKFEKTLEAGLKQVDKMITSGQGVTGSAAFDIYQTYGFPLEMTEEIVVEKGGKMKNREGFFALSKKHQEISRAGVKSKFGGGGVFSPKLHTATHLLHTALRKILGEHVKQMGSDITSERLRFDFSHPRKMTEEEIKKVEDLVNSKIKEDLEIEKEEMKKYEEALKSGALAFFKEEYPERVMVYTIGDFSKEICAGPHVKRTSELGFFKIIKEESLGAGVRRIRAVLK